MIEFTIEEFRTRKFSELSKDKLTQNHLPYFLEVLLCQVLNDVFSPSYLLG